MLFPQLAQQSEVASLEEFLLNPKWVGQQKVDGHRIHLVSPGGDFPPTALTRNGTPYTRRLPAALRDYRFPGDHPAGSWVIDGELVDGVLWAFDLPRCPTFTLDSNLSLAVDPGLTERFLILQELLKLTGGPIRLLPLAQTREEKIHLADVALRQGFEGLVFKRADSHYASGARNLDWVKVKFTKSIDCVVLAVRDDGKDSVKLGLYDPAGNLVEVGRSSLIGKEKAAEINPGDVIELRYLYAGAGGRLYQPTILKRRTDKDASECSTDQMVFVNKSVLASL